MQPKRLNIRVTAPLMGKVCRHVACETNISPQHHCLSEIQTVLNMLIYDILWVTALMSHGDEEQRYYNSKHVVIPVVSLQACHYVCICTSYVVLLIPVSYIMKTKCNQIDILVHSFLFLHFSLTANRFLFFLLLRRPLHCSSPQGWWTAPVRTPATVCYSA